MSFRLYMYHGHPVYPNVTRMGFVFVTNSKKVVVIDGGWYRDEVHLAKLIYEATGHTHVDVWFLTHQHPDHIGALGCTLLLNGTYKPGDMPPLRTPAVPALTVEKIYANFVDDSWIEKYAPQENTQPREYARDLFETTREVSDRLQHFAGVCGFQFLPLDREITEDIEVDGIKFEVITTRMDAAAAEASGANLLNDSSAVIRAHGAGQRILFLADLGKIGGNRLLSQLSDESLIKADWVQMAHHGNYGVSREFYEKIGFSNVLWPTEQQVWNLKVEQDPNHDYDIYTVKEWIREILHDDPRWNRYVAGLATAGPIKIDFG